MQGCLKLFSQTQEYHVLDDLLIQHQVQQRRGGLILLLNWEICRIECRVARFVVLSVYPRLLSQMFSPSDISVRAAAVVRLRAVRAVVILAGACEQSPLTSSSRSCRATDSSSRQVLAGAAADKSSRAELTQQLKLACWHTSKSGRRM